MTDIQGFFADKNVNIVSPLGGQFSWFTDWVADGSKQYQTYMTKELPPLINKELKTNGRNAVGGLSSTGGTAIDYAVQAPGLSKAVGSYSGFPAPSDPDAAQQVSLTLGGGGASAEAMWDPLGGPLRIAHDPSKNVTKLNGVGVYAAASGGAQGDVDRLAPGTANFTGGLIEGIVLANTQKFADAAAAAGVPINFVVRPEGSHTWGLFESEMQESWKTTIGPALGVR
jgi:S-formylglutathione hydrolase FrmB